MPGCTWWTGNLEKEELVLTASYTVFEQMPRLSALPLTSTFCLKIPFPGNNGETEKLGRP